MTERARWIVGIDLGTTNSALAAVDTTAGDAAPIEIVPVPQLVAAGLVEPHPTLPSFLLLPGPGELPDGALALPWTKAQTWAVGQLARARGAELPQRLVSSAKSWLGHGGVDRRGLILPAAAGATAEASDTQKVSPVSASARYLAHLRAAWDHAHPDEPLGEQEVVLTVPASFDAVARELTMEAAETAGLEHVTLLEEPQAAFYSYLAHKGDTWRKELKVGDVVLVVDVGGGTTDFSLIAVADAGDGNLALERIAVGDHLLLGGDNMDLTLAYRVGETLREKGATLDAWQERALVQSCRTAKEQLLQTSGAPKKTPIAVLGRGSKLIGGALKTELTAELATEVLVDGFFPECPADAKPQKSKRAGLTELGLPYASDPAITRHLAAFLARFGRMPTAVLWNGGVMKAGKLRQRLLGVLTSWLGAPPRELSGTDLDLAVAHGAACYGLLGRGRGVRIRGGTARTYYVGVETAMPAVPGLPPPIKAICVVPFGMEEGSEAAVPAAQLGLVVGEAVEFRFLGSATRRGDALGAVLEGAAVRELDELAPIEATLPAADGLSDGQVVPVSLRSHVTAVGTLDLFCVGASGQRWKLEFNVREQD